MHHGLLQVKGGLSIGLFGLTDGERGPGTSLHELSLRCHGQALAGRALDVVVAFGGFERVVSKVTMHGFREAESDMLVVLAVQGAGCAVGAVTVQVIIGAPPAPRGRPVPALFAFAALATVLG